MKNSFEEKVSGLRQEVFDIKDVDLQDIVEKTAKRLEHLNYAPPVAIPVRVFFRLTRKSLLIEMEKFLELPDEEVCPGFAEDILKCREMRIQTLAVLVFYYKKLILLRQEDGESWDEIDELYVHD